MSGLNREEHTSVKKGVHPLGVFQIKVDLVDLVGHVIVVMDWGCRPALACRVVRIVSLL